MTIPTRSCAVALATAIVPAAAGSFSTVIDVGTGEPGGDFIDGHIGSDTQLNLYDGGLIGQHADFGPDDGTGYNTEVNIYGGATGNHLDTYRGSTVNISNGTVGGFFDALAGSTVNIAGGAVGGYFDAGAGSVVNISGGSVGGLFHAREGSVVSVTGGTIGPSFRAYGGGLVRLAGGTFGDFFRADAGSTVEIIGSSFTLDGAALDGLTPGGTLPIGQRGGALLEGVFADGTAFEFELNGQLYNGDVFDPGATLSVTLVPSPGVLAAVPVVLLAGARRRG